METKVISFGNHKGGVAKTTTTANVGSILASKGYKVLVIDLDAQANLTVSLLKEEPENSIYYALTGEGIRVAYYPCHRQSQYRACFSSTCHGRDGTYSSHFP